MTSSNLTGRYLEIDASVDPIEKCFEMGWTDGLPVVPPTEGRVQRMVEASGQPPSALMARIPPAWGRATIEKIAVNAVLAGCRPEYMPVILAGLRAMCDEQFNLHGVQGTTHVATPLFIVNGPVRLELDINGGPNAWGQGWRANATIGRALRLIQTNLGGAKPGAIDKSCQGMPGKYTYCVAENEEENPWEPLHVGFGFARDESTVTAFAADNPITIQDHSSTDGRNILRTIADSLAHLGNMNVMNPGQTVLALCPEHTRTLHRDGWTKEDIQHFLFDEARRPLAEITRGRTFAEGQGIKAFPRWVDQTRGESRVPIVASPEDFLIIVTGGNAGRFSLGVPQWGSPRATATRAVTVKIE